MNEVIKCTNCGIKDDVWDDTHLCRSCENDYIDIQMEIIESFDCLIRELKELKNLALDKLLKEYKITGLKP